MASSHATSLARRPRCRSDPCRTAWMSERQLDAYLQARETLRRVGAAARTAVDASQPAAPPPLL